VKFKKTAVLLGGALLGCFQIAFMFLSGGMGHGISTFARLLQALYFGYGSALFFGLPVLQYSAYCYVAYFKIYRLGITLAILHYLGAAAFIAYSISIGNVDLTATFSDKKFSIESAVVDLTWFVFLNFLYFKRVLAGKLQSEIR
jgi:hypothetical protein